MPPSIETFTKYGCAGLPGDFGGIAAFLEKRPLRYLYSGPCGGVMPNCDLI
ncbi:Uncharacterised protein [Mycobacteroides abscessus subsp. abscessus]|nr:Uncharacterised protein [Mycobacteroides abscessus subsp. abscessus]